MRLFRLCRRSTGPDKEKQPKNLGSNRAKDNGLYSNCIVLFADNKLALKDKEMILLKRSLSDRSSMSNRLLSKLKVKRLK